MKDRTPKADINFEKELWSAANELRGAVSENQYKDFVLSLIFLKHLSERYEMRYEELNNMLHDPKSEYYTTDRQEIIYVLEDPDEYKSKYTFKLPKEATWHYLKDNAEQDDIKVKVDKAFTIIDDILAESDSGLKGILPPIFVKSQLTARQTAGLINLFSQKKFSEKENPESDIIGRIYEYYIGKFAMVEGSGAGQFFTPGSIVRLLVDMLQPYKGRIFDPACGSGGMFVQSMKFVEAHGGRKGDISIYGQESIDNNLRLCKMNLVLRNLPFDLKLGNSLLDDKFPDLKADFVITNPPFNVSQWHPEDLADDDPRLLGKRTEFTTDGNANYMWMQTFYSHLNELGTAGFVMANGAMTTNNTGEKIVRQYMVDNGIIDCIVRLPDKLFMTTGIPACLFFLSKNREGKDCYRTRKNEILFINATKIGRMATRRLRVFRDEDVAKVSGAYNEWRKLDGHYEDVAGFCKVTTLEEVKNHDYKLTPGTYVGTEDEEDDGVPFEEKMKLYVDRLKNQFTKSNELQIKILNNLINL